MKLTIEQLKNYLGTGLKCETGQKETWTIEQYLTRNSVGFANDKINGIKPICYRLSDLDKFIPELGFVPWERLNEMYANYEQGFKIDMTHSDLNKESKWVFFQYHKDNWGCQSWVPFEIYSTIFQWHFWPFGDEYFEDGLVIDKLLYNSPTN